MSTEAPSNPRLAAAIESLLDAPSEELEPKLRGLLEQLAASTLIGGDELEVETDEGLFLALFTDLVELHFFEPGGRWSRVEAAEALRRVARGDYDGLVVNPGRRQLELSREDVLDFFELDPIGG
jgi:hypothetical protein